MQPLYVGVQVHARPYYTARACVWLVVDVCTRFAAATVAVYYQNVTTSTLHAIGPHRTTVSRSLLIILFFSIAISLFYDLYVSTSLRLPAIGVIYRKIYGNSVREFRRQALVPYSILKSYYNILRNAMNVCNEYFRIYKYVNSELKMNRKLFLILRAR